MAEERSVYAPVSEKQKLALQDNYTDVICVGGSAGGGKTRTIIMKNLDAIHDPHFKCAIFRRSVPELTRQGGIVSESKSVYPEFGGIYKTQARTWVFPSGAEIALNAIDSDTDLGGFQGAQLVRIFVDEAADKWTEHQVLFLLSRLRSAHSKIKPQLILTCNPDINSFLKSWVDFSLNEDGVPVEGTEKRVRWFTVQDSKVLWADSAEECYEKYGKPRDLIYAVGLSEAEIKNIHPSKLFFPKSFRFIPTGVFDNPYLLPPRNTSYLANLLAQPRVNQLKFLHGSWTAKAEGDGFFDRRYVELVDRPPHDAVSKIRSWDLAYSVPSETYRDPDFTAGVKMSRDRYGIYYIEDVVRFRKMADGVLKEIISTAQKDGSDVQITIPKDNGGGKASAVFFLRTLAENGVAARTVPITNRASKVARFQPFAALAESGSVRVVRGDWNEEFFQELENFSYDSRGHDDMVDATSDAFNIIAQSLQIPSFTMPNLSRQSIIAKKLT